MVRWPRVLTRTHLTQIVKSQKNPSTALELFHGAKSRYPDYRHNGPVYAAMISLLGTSNKIPEMKEVKGLCEEGRLDAATCLLHSMFWRISTKGNGKDVVVYRILLDALCDSGRVDEALDVLDKVLRKGLRAPRRNHLRLDLSQYCNERNVEAVKCVINEALVRGVAPGPNTYTSIYREGKTSQADIVLGQALSGGFRPSIVTYEAKLAALCKDCRIREAVRVMEVEMVEANYVPTIRMYNILLKGLCDSGDSAAAVGYLRKMAKQIGCVPNQETYSILVHGLCQDCKFIEASQLLEEMLKRSHWPPAGVFNAVIRGLCSVGRQYEAVMWLEEMISQDKLPEPCVWNSLLQSSCPNVVGVGMLEQLCS